MKRADRQGRRWVDGGRWGLRGHGVRKETRGKGNEEGNLGEGRKVESDDEKRAGGDKRG